MAKSSISFINQQLIKNHFNTDFLFIATFELIGDIFDYRRVALIVIYRSFEFKLPVRG